MRELLVDAAEAVWWLLTAPLRQIVRDTLAENPPKPATGDSPALKWSDMDRPLEHREAVPVAAMLGLRQRP